MVPGGGGGGWGGSVSLIHLPQITETVATNQGNHAGLR